jgi:hypothetical protein
MSHCAAVKARRRAKRKAAKREWRFRWKRISVYSSSTWAPGDEPMEELVESTNRSLESLTETIRGMSDEEYGVEKP